MEWICQTALDQWGCTYIFGPEKTYFDRVTEIRQRPMKMKGSRTFSMEVESVVSTEHCYSNY